MTQKADIHQEITDKIIAKLEAGVVPWSKCWDGSCGFNMPRRSNGELYSGINTIVLWVAAEESGYLSDTWMTFKQAKALGGAVRKGEKSTKVVFYKALNIEDKETGEDKKIPMLKTYSVFNVEQIDGLPEDRYAAPAVSIGTGESHIPEIRDFFAATGARILNAPNHAPCYAPLSDTIKMPEIGAFTSAHAYYGTLAHELIHWTGAGSRLDRDKKYNTTEGRAFEELIAELGSLFLCARIGAQPSEDSSAAYIASWLAALKNDKKFIFQAASQAQKACNFAIDRSEAKKSEPLAA